MVGIRSKQLTEWENHNYLENDQYREQKVHGHDMYADQNDLTRKQIWGDPLLLRQLQEEEREHFLKQNNQAEYDVLPKYHIGRYQIKTGSKDEQLQETDDKAFVRSTMTDSVSS